MLFSSTVFLFLFLPVFLLLYFLLPATRCQWLLPGLSWRNAFLLVGSLLFYAWGEGVVVGVLLLSALLNYVAGLLIQTGYRQVGLWVSLVGSLSLLFYFKYVGFAASVAGSLAGVLGFPAKQWSQLAHVALPIGISFYTFQGISYVLDVYWGRIRANRSFIDYSTYVAMFPHQIAGPIVRYSDIAPELADRQTSMPMFAEGVERFVIGLAKKVLLANSVALVADTIFDAPLSTISTPTAWVGIVAYSLQIYFDFSGYSDMAIGLGKLLGFDFKENFNYPYTARSVQDFWRRWHISLSSWFRDYLYVPLGGNRGTAWQTYRNLLIVFFVTGLWHGASWNFIIWGLFHGCFLLIERAGLAQWLKRGPALLGHVYTLLVVLVGWVLFRSADLSSALTYLARLAGFGQLAGWPTTYPLTAPLLGTFVLAFVLATPVYHVWKRYWQNRPTARWHDPAYVLSLFGLFFVAVMYLAASSYNPFIYFRF
jgi:alginate O-acetyltransferase complex protein AlgI